jgi:UDP-N-acetylglucosamine--N-acetylmuramyl-(pentapeptide) pyrophosphoryl-undecaprenol N-acetylglucosamine transferase
MNVVIAGGGTAGHVNPGIAVARELTDARVTFVGTSHGAESRLVPESGFRLERVDLRGWDRSRPHTLPATGLRASGAVWAARRVLRDSEAQVVLGMGGYVSFPACAAAKTLGIPIVIHEQNIVFGLANRVCKPLARVVAVSFEESLPAAGRRGVCTGNPVLPELARADLGAERDTALSRWDLDPGRRTLLVFGGSQGAARINRAAFELASLWRDRTNVQILHITGPAGYEMPRHGHLIYRSVPYVGRMVEAYAVADLALCRGGATTIAELGVTGVPSIIVPYPHHRDRQQERHGRVLERAGAAVVLLDADATGANVAGLADDLLNDEDRLSEMRAAARAFGRPDAADRLAAVVSEVSR